MKVTPLNWISLLCVAAMAGAAFWLYDALPDPMPSHWNAAGEVDDWTPKPWGVWLMPMITAGLWIMFMILPLISPKGFRLDKARRAYDAIWFFMVLFMAAIQVVTFGAALGEPFRMEQVVPLMTGGLFIILGNYLGKFPRNFFVGIRTPWTLASEEVWNRTHRLSAWVFIAVGVLIAASPLLFDNMLWFVGPVIIAALFPVIYSLVLYRRLHGFEATEE